MKDDNILEGLSMKRKASRSSSASRIPFTTNWFYAHNLRLWKQDQTKKITQIRIIKKLILSAYHADAHTHQALIGIKQVKGRKTVLVNGWDKRMITTPGSIKKEKDETAQDVVSMSSMYWRT